MRTITHIIVSYWTNDDPKFGMKDIDKLYRACGYLGTPYHLLVKRDGTLETGRKVDQPGPINHPHADSSVNVCILIPNDDLGTGEKSRYTTVQQEAVRKLLTSMQAVHPNAVLEAFGPNRDKVCE